LTGSGREGSEDAADAEGGRRPPGTAAGRVVVVGLGPAGPDLVTAGTLGAVERVPPGRRFVRTTRHPSATVVGGAASFDAVYEAAGTLEEVYDRIASDLAAAAAEHGEVLYAVPGSPAVAERSVHLLLSRPDVDVEVLPALSFLDLAWARLGVDPVAAGAVVVDGHRFEEEAAGERGPLLVAQCDRRDVLSAVKLAVDGDGLPPVTLLHHLGLPDERVVEVPWAELDRTVEPDHLTSLWVPRLAAPVAGEVARFAELVRTLRRECPWDRQQTHASLARHLVEETYETVDAIDGLGPEGAGADHLEEELGDLLFQVVFHATLAAEEGWFTLADVARGIHDKLVARHPHVFGDVEATTAASVEANWERLKQAEKARASVMDGIPSGLPALLYAAKVQRRAESVGLAPPAPGRPVPVADPATEDDLGDLLFAVVDRARRSGLDPEGALRAAATRFRRHVEASEPDTPS
jgi:tetrapyrrole methylase family protein / MazG family protein